ncbi:putative reverse transcriptase domain-containing protein, partial [Tanacetum coccineum]
DGGDDSNDEDESFDDDEDDDVNIEGDEEEEEHPAPADSTVVAYQLLIRPHLMSIQDEPPTPFWSEAEVAKLLAIPLPPPSPLSPCCDDPAESRGLIYFPFTTATYHTLPHQRADTPPSGIALGLRYEVGESSSALIARPPGGFRADYGFVANMDREIMRDLDRDVGYGITDTWDEMLFSTRVRQDTDEIYVRLDDEQTERQLMAGRLNMLYRDRRAYARTALLMEREARMSREAWGRSMNASDLARSEVMSLRTTVLDQQADPDEQKFESQQGPAKGPTQPDALEEAGVTAALAARDADRNMKGDDSHNSGTGVRRTERTARECTYTDFLKCQPLKFKGMKGVVVALTWWNTHVKTVGHDAAYGTDVIGYNQRFQELALLCVRMFPEESDKIERYVGGLPDMIHGSVVASKPKTMQEAIEIATELMDKKIRTFAERQTENKRKQDDNHQQPQQQQNKRQNTGRAYTAGSGEKKPYGGSKPLCAKCNYHHDGPCAPKCHKCNRVGHLARDCRSTANANTANNQRGTGAGQKPTCYECGAQGHFKRDYPKLKNNNRSNQVGNGNAPAKVYAVGRAGTNPDSNAVTGTFLLNNRYASILFDTGADRSFVSTAFSSQIDITPTALDHYYDVELADGRIIGLNTILRGCTLNFLNHPFNIDLMPIELGSFDAIIGMDWLAKYQAIIVCAEKIVRIPWGNETLIVRDDGSNWGNETLLNIISYTKTHEYMLKGCPVFLANVTTKETGDKSKKKRLKDVSIV